jgi:hypothetical protein
MMPPCKPNPYPSPRWDREAVFLTQSFWPTLEKHFAEKKVAGAANPRTDKHERQKTKRRVAEGLREHYYSTVPNLVTCVPWTRFHGVTPST